MVKTCTIETADLHDLHTLLDGLTVGEHVKATWSHSGRTITVEGPVYASGREVWCDRAIRRNDGAINISLTSVEVTRDEEVTFIRDDNEESMIALLESLEDGEEVTAVWRDEYGSTTITGTVRTTHHFQELHGYSTGVLRWRDNGELLRALCSVTVRRPVVKRWERDGDE